MNFKRTFALLFAVFIAFMAFPVTTRSESTIVLTLSSSLESGQSLKLGDTVTYTVALSSNDGLAGGTLFFSPSDNLEYVSATFKGMETEALLASGQGNEGAYGIRFMGDIFTDDYDSFCSITFRVVNDGTAEIEFYPYELTNGAIITPTVVNGTIDHPIDDPENPVVQSSQLPEGVMGYTYSAKLEGNYDPDFLTFRVSEGDLPDGLTLSPDGTISGTPTVYGDFTFTVVATLLDKLDSEPKEISVSILERPRRLELTDESSYEIDEEDYLTGVKERTTAADLIESFKHNEHVKIFDPSGNEVTSGSVYIGTGYTISLMHEGERVHTVTVVVKGDIDGDGIIAVFDYLNIRLHYMRKQLLEGVSLKAADVDGDGIIAVFDYLNVRLHYMKKLNIYE